MAMPAPICFKFDMQFAEREARLTLAATGIKIPANIKMIAITTKSSISVKPLISIPFYHRLLDSVKRRKVPQNLAQHPKHFPPDTDNPFWWLRRFALMPTLRIPDFFLGVGNPGC
jgi:hypothetical protein